MTETNVIPTLSHQDDDVNKNSPGPSYGKPSKFNKRKNNRGKNKVTRWGEGMHIVSLILTAVFDNEH